MEWYASVLIGVGLAMDAFAVSLGVGTTGKAKQPRSIFRVSLHMGFFQGLMTFLGWLAGLTIAKYIAAFDHWIAFGLLAFVGIRMMRSGLSSESETKTEDLTRGGRLLMVCIATSIDAMAVGLSLSMLDVEILSPSLTIGVVTFGLSLIGILVGGKLGETFGKRMEILGGLILIGIGLRILIEHIF